MAIGPPVNKAGSVVDYCGGGGYLYCPFFKTRGLDQYCREAQNQKSKCKMKKKPDLVLLLFIVFGLCVAMSALGQVLGF